MIIDASGVFYLTNGNARNFVISTQGHIKSFEFKGHYRDDNYDGVFDDFVPITIEKYKDEETLEILDGLEDYKESELGEMIGFPNAIVHSNTGFLRISDTDLN